MNDPRGGRGRWWMLPGAVTVLLLLFNSPLVLIHFPRLFHLKKRALALHNEMNFAVWWSAVLLLLGAAIFYELTRRAPRPRGRAYLQLSLLMLAMLADEVGSFHEWISGLGGWPALAPFGLVGLLLLGDSLRILWRDERTRTVAWLVLVGFLVLGSVALQEYAEHNWMTREWRVTYGRSLEEASEIVGVWVILFAAVYARRGMRLGGSLAAVVPDPVRMPRLLPIIAVGFLAHLLACQFVFVKIGVWDGRPSAIYPTVVFFLLACYAYWVPRHRHDEGARSPEVRGFWAAAGLLFLALSIGSMQNFWGLLARVVPGLTKPWFYDQAPLWLCLVLAGLFIGLALWRRGDRRLLLLLLLPLAMWIRVDLQHAARRHLAGGLFAGLCAVALMRPDSWAGRGGPIESPSERSTSDEET